jgi:RNA-directed DNA polymerase
LELVSGKRPKTQQKLAFPPEDPGEAPRTDREGTEPRTANQASQSPVGDIPLMEQICARENLIKAWERVRSNAGAPGVDGLTIERTQAYLREHWPTIREQLLAGTYQPQPVRRVEIPKPDGGVRLLGIPTVLDRLIQQAILQVLSPQWDPTFSESSFGFRPHRSAHQAIAQAQAFIREGHEWVVDIDLEKFFDRVNHDVLMGRVAKRVSDKRVLKLIRAYLCAGVMENGLVSPSDEGTPQGGPLSPLLSNLLLDELDQELERRGHKFCRYADDCNIYVRSQRAGERVMESVTRFLTKRLKLKVNASKSAVGRPRDRKFLGFRFTWGPEFKRAIAPKALDRFKERIRGLTKRTCGASVDEVVRRLASYLNGWGGYFGFCETPTVLKLLDGWIRRRIRAILWTQWKTWRNRKRMLQSLGVPERRAAQAAAASRGPWAMATNAIVHEGLSIRYFTELGLPSLLEMTRT